jgi:hypothetical protein
MKNAAGQKQSDKTGDIQNSENFSISGRGIGLPEHDMP